MARRELEARIRNYELAELQSLNRKLAGTVVNLKSSISRLESNDRAWKTVDPLQAQGRSLRRQLSRTLTSLKDSISEIDDRRRAVGGKQRDPLVAVTRNRRGWDDVYHWLDSGCGWRPTYGHDLMPLSEAKASGRRLCSSSACQAASRAGV